MPWVIGAGVAAVGMLGSYLKGKWDAYNAPSSTPTPFNLILYIILGAVGLAMLKQAKFLGE